MTEEEKVSGYKTNVVTITSLEEAAEVADKKLKVFYDEHREAIKTYRRLGAEKSQAHQDLDWARRCNHERLLREAGWQELEVHLNGEDTFLFSPKIDISRWEGGVFRTIWSEDASEFYEWLNGLNRDDYIKPKT